MYYKYINDIHKEFIMNIILNTVLTSILIVSSYTAFANGPYCNIIRSEASDIKEGEFPLSHIKECLDGDLVELHEIVLALHNSKSNMEEAEAILKEAGKSENDILEAYQKNELLRQRATPSDINQLSQDKEKTPQCSQILEKESISALQLLVTGLAPRYLVDLGFSKDELLSAGAMPSEINQVSQDKEKGPQCSQILSDLNIQLSDLLQKGYTILELIDAGYSDSDLIKALSVESDEVKSDPDNVENTNSDDSAQQNDFLESCKKSSFIEMNVYEGDGDDYLKITKCEGDKLTIKLKNSSVIFNCQVELQKIDEYDVWVIDDIEMFDKDKNKILSFNGIIVDKEEEGMHPDTSQCFLTSFSEEAEYEIRMITPSSPFWSF